MATLPQDFLLVCLRRMMNPIIRFCLRHSLRIQEVYEAAKFDFIKLAADELQNTGVEPNISNLSAMTGLHRRDVMRLYRDESSIDEPRNLISRIIGQWQQDKRFTTKAGAPRVLSFEGENSDFRNLVRLMSGDLKPGTVLAELERLHVVERTPRGLRLLRPSYMPRENVAEGFGMLSDDMNDLISSVEQNIFDPPAVPNLHARTEYDKVRADAVQKIRVWLMKEGSKFHRRARAYISNFDLDINPNLKGPVETVRVVLGTFTAIDKRGVASDRPKMTKPKQRNAHAK